MKRVEARGSLKIGSEREFVEIDESKFRHKRKVSVANDISLCLLIWAAFPKAFLTQRCLSVTLMVNTCFPKLSYSLLKFIPRRC